MKIIMFNADTGGVMEWSFESEVMSHLFVPFFFDFLGEIPEHHYSESGELFGIQLDTKQINRVREKAKPWMEQNSALEKLYTDMTFLLTCSGPIVLKK
ncbi:MAG: hypothetical protein KKE62_06045 [Proteobacteria bacterium]|nr:hypothetical protein [Pseudomonadota bacterium]MBU1542389.1 hypothetical protein [Pseudomonadota bacterium]MBU2481176.1 hypothetical protein [Pseudomonadota bacterium]